MRQRSSLIFFWILLALAIIVRCKAIWTPGSGLLEDDPDNYRELAVWLQNGYADGSFDYGRYGQYAHRPPLYPLLLSLLSPTSSELWSWAVGGFHLATGLLTVGVVYWLGHKWSSSNLLASAAAMLVAVDPILLRQSAQVMTETLATLLASVALLGLTFAMERGSRFWPFALAGALCGLCVLCRPTFIVWSTLSVGFIVLRSVQKRTSIDPLVAWMLGFALLATPWVVRNKVQFGRAVLTTTHGGYTFFRANNPMYYAHLRSQPLGTVWTTDDFDRDWQIEYRAAGLSEHNWQEVDKDRLAYKKGIRAIRDEPGMFLYACLIRLERFYGRVPWQTDPYESARGRWLRYGIGLFYFIEFALAIVGVCTLGRKLFAPPWIWGTLLVISFTLVHTFYWTDMRMRAPIVPVIALLAAVGAGWVWGRVRPAACIATR